MTKGRPLKASEKAADTRRRTQIREAQRAYRARQQNRLLQLEERNSLLEDVVDSLSQALDLFCKQVKPSLSSASPLALQVSVLEETTRSQLRRVRDISEDNSADATLSMRTAEEKSPHEVFFEPHSGLPDISCKSRAHPGGSGSGFWPLFFRTSSITTPNVVPVDPHVQLEAPMVNSGIAYATTPFTQRLYHACAKNGYRFVRAMEFTDQDVWPHFGPILESVPRAHVVSYFQRVLAVTPCNPVTDHRFPFISLGGAGTHYSRTAETSKTSKKHRNLLPFEITNGIREIPCDEKWFDVHDVEGYLANQGIQVIQVPFSTANTQHIRNENEALVDSDLSIIRHKTRLTPISSDLNRQINDPPRMVVREDVFIEGLSMLCVCLGCVAGFRQSDVETFLLQNVQWV